MRKTIAVLATIVAAVVTTGCGIHPTHEKSTMEKIGEGVKDLSKGLGSPGSSPSAPGGAYRPAPSPLAGLFGTPTAQRVPSSKVVTTTEEGDLLEDLPVHMTLSFFPQRGKAVYLRFGNGRMFRVYTDATGRTVIHSWIELFAPVTDPFPAANLTGNEANWLLATDFGHDNPPGMMYLRSATGSGPVSLSINQAPTP